MADDAVGEDAVGEDAVGEDDLDLWGGEGATESSESEEELRAIFADLDAVIRTEPEVGDYDQTF